uniref:K Homology domain-containing protein n=1 Tax=Panagrolaimus sp. ES5 TaxID=591445 RepID=A0AC34G379_9BILA
MSSEFIEKTVYIPEHLCGYIIGTKGRTIKEMQEKHGVKLFLLDEKMIIKKEGSDGIHWYEPGKPLKIIAPPEKFAALLEEIEKMVKHGGLPRAEPVGWYASDEKMRRILATFKEEKDNVTCGK